MRFVFLILMLAAAALLITTGSLETTAAEPSAGAALPFASSTTDWCQTQEVFNRRYPDRYSAFGPSAACPLEGDCDITENRDASIPAPDQPLITIRLKFNVFCNDDGSNCAGTQADVDAQVAQINADYAPSRINFIYETEFINSSQFRSWADAEEYMMKATYADQPEKQCNIYVVYVEGSYSFGTFPWDPQATQNQGGIVLTEPAFGPNEETLTHELGHNLGLWHTHHGVSEVNECSQCWEKANKSNGDVAGDFCSDTDPTPVNYNCGGPPGSDPCTGGMSWGATHPHNYMGYAGDMCWNNFSEQQKGRMQCWIASQLTGWMAVDVFGTPRAGSESATVDFSYGTPFTVIDQTWYFGDGDFATSPAPTHTYGPGIYDVGLVLTTDVGVISTTQSDFVTVWADTIEAPPAEDKIDSAGYWELEYTNAVPIDELILPIQITNVPAVLRFDSISFVGTRADYFESKQLIYDNGFVGQLAMKITADNGGGSPPLPPGSGPIARVHYRVRYGASAGDTSFVSAPQLGPYTLLATTRTTSFTPHFIGATLLILESCICPHQGDIDQNAVIDAVDLSSVIDIVFFSGTDPKDAQCPTTRADFNADLVADAVDLSEVIDHVFFGGTGPADPCGP